MRIKLKTHTTTNSREQIARMVAATVGAGHLCAEIPYKANAGVDLYWVVDQNNDWRIIFAGPDANIFEITYRYKDESAVEGLTRWMAYRLGADLVA